MSIPKIAATRANAVEPTAATAGRISTAADRINTVIVIWNIVACAMLLLGVFSGFALLVTMGKEASNWASIWGGILAGSMFLALATRTVALCLELAIEGRP